MPCLAHRIHGSGDYDAEPMVLEAVWREPLMAISAESLAAEGFASFDEFRRAWMIAERRRFRRLDLITASRVRPWTPGDTAEMGDMLLRRLYGDFVRDGHSEPVAGYAPA